MQLGLGPEGMLMCGSESCRDVLVRECDGGDGEGIVWLVRRTASRGLVDEIDLRQSMTDQSRHLVVGISGRIERYARQTQRS